MKISIETGGSTIEVSEAKPATPQDLVTEPPPELLVTARRLGAQNAGIASFSMPLGEPAAGISATKALVAGIALPDADAGPASGLERQGSATSAPTTGRRSSRRVRR